MKVSKFLVPAIIIFFMLFLFPAQSLAEGDPDVERVNVSNDEVEAEDTTLKNGGTHDISIDGRYIAFPSLDDALVEENDVDGYSLYVRDVTLGTTELISFDENGDQLEEMLLIAPSISSDGRYVSFTAFAGTTVIYRYDRQTDTAVRVNSTPLPGFFFSSISGDGQTIIISKPLIDSTAPIYMYQSGSFSTLFAESDYSRAMLSRNGRFVAFISEEDLLPGDTNEDLDIYVYDITADSLERVSVDEDGDDFPDIVFSPAISEDGRYVSFTVIDTSEPAVAIYLRDTVLDTSVEIFSTSDEAIYVSTISDNGRFVAISESLTGATITDLSPVFVYDRVADDTNVVVPGYDNCSVTISGDGRYLSFLSDDDELVPDDTNGLLDTFRIENPYADTDGDGEPDIVDPLFFTETEVTKTGLTDSLNILVGGQPTSELFSGEEEVIFYDGDEEIMRFDFDFDEGELDLSRVSIIEAENALVVDLDGQLQEGETKTLTMQNNSFTSLCVKNAPITSIAGFSTDCTGEGEYDFSACLANGSYSVDGLSCTYSGNVISVSGLDYSGIFAQANLAETGENIFPIFLFMGVLPLGLLILPKTTVAINRKK